MLRPAAIGPHSSPTPLAGAARKRRGMSQQQIPHRLPAPETLEDGRWMLARLLRDEPYNLTKRAGPTLLASGLLGRQFTQCTEHGATYVLKQEWDQLLAEGWPKSFLDLHGRRFI